MPQSIARKHLCQLAKLSFQQQDGLVTALLLGLRRIDALNKRMPESVNETQYGDSIVRQMIECIKVHGDGRMAISFGGGYEVEERL